MRGRGTLRIPAVLAFVAAAGFLSSCGPTYPRERVAQSLVQLCRDEHGLEVQAQVAGSTLGVLVPIPGLIDELRRRSGSGVLNLPAVLVEGQFNRGQFDFQFQTRGPFVRVNRRKAMAAADEREARDRREEPAEPMKKLQKVSMGILRVCLSTDAKLEFYQLIARDPGPDKLDVILSGHIGDSKRVQFYAISIGELQSRSEFAVRHRPEALARDTVAQFLQDLGRRPLPQLLSRYTSPSKRFGDLLPKVLLTAVALQGRHGELLREQGSWPVRQFHPSRVLVLVPMNAIGERDALLFTVELLEGAGAFLDIERLEGGRIPARFQNLGDPARWGGSFFLEAIQLPKFLADQIMRKTSAEFQPLDPDSDADSDARPATHEEVTRVLAETAATVVQSYEFKDFERIAVTDSLKGTRWQIRASDLPLYRRRNPPELKALP